MHRKESITSDVQSRYFALFPFKTKDRKARQEKKIKLYIVCLKLFEADDVLTHKEV